MRSISLCISLLLVLMAISQPQVADGLPTGSHPTQLTKRGANAPASDATLDCEDPPLVTSGGVDSAPPPPVTSGFEPTATLPPPIKSAVKPPSQPEPQSHPNFTISDPTSHSPTSHEDSSKPCEICSQDHSMPLGFGASMGHSPFLSISDPIGKGKGDLSENY